MTDGAAVRLRGWGWRHAGRSRWALRGVDLDIDAGERVLLLGPSGAGKSTLLHGLAGLLDPEGGETEGEITVDGLDPRAARDRTGLVMQDPETQLVMARAGDDVAFGLENHAVPEPEIWPRVSAALAAVGFPYAADRATDRLSGGEQQRLVLAGCLALRPSLVLLDEPTANLDPAGAATVRALVRDVLSDGRTLVLVEHRVGDVVDLVDRVVVLEPGAGVLADGPPADVLGRHAAQLAARGVWVPGVDLPRAPRTAPPGEVVVRGAGLGQVYPGAPVAAVADATLEVHAGEAAAVVGPNGSGKSTLALLVAGLVRPTSGAAYAGPPGLARVSPALRERHRLADRPLDRWPAPALASAVGTVFQDPEHQFVTRSVRDELALGPRLAGEPPPTVSERVDELLAVLHLDALADANPFTLSGGEARRLSVATAIATRPAGLVLDEPTFGQDRRTWVGLLDLLAGLRADGAGLLVVTHDEAFVDALADRVLAMRDGRLS